MSSDETPSPEPPRRPERRRGRRRWRGRLFALALALVPFGLLELGLRVQGMRYPPLELPIAIWGQDRDDELRAAEALHRFDVETMWAPRGDAVIPWARDQRTSPGGFRGEDPDPSATLRVLVLGDSSTFGYGVRDEETYGEALERRLAAAFPAERVQVLNGGIVGSTIRQGLARYAEVARDWTPHVVVEAFGAVNEHWPVVGLDDAQKQALLREEDTLLARVRRAAREHLRVVHLGAWLSDRAAGGREREVEDLNRTLRTEIRTANEYLAHPDYRRRVSPADFGAALVMLHAAVEAEGARLVCLAMPRPAATEERLPPVLDYDPVLRRFAADAEVPLIDAHEDFRASPAGDDALFCDAYHPSALGQDRIAELLLPVVAEHLGEARTAR